MNASEAYFLKLARAILENMALENEREWWQFWVPRWSMSDESLREDARNLLAQLAEFEKHEARKGRDADRNTSRDR